MKERGPEGVVVASGPRFSVRAAFAVAVVFVAAAPAFWLRLEVKGGEFAEAYENVSLYQDTYPTFHYGFGRVRAGEVPLWNPKQLCGVPFQADPASGLFQPLNLVFALAPTNRALVLHAFICLSLMGLFFVLLARSFGAGHVAALVGGVAYAFSGASAAAISRPALANALVWTPLLLLGIHEYARTFRLRQAAFGGVAGGLLLLSGAQGLVVAMLMLAMVYAGFVVAFPGRGQCPNLFRRCEGFVVMAVVAAAVSAVQWAPALMWAWSLDAPLPTLLPLEVAGEIPGSIRELFAQILVPRPGALPRIGYLGALVLPLVPAALFHRTSRREAFLFLFAGTLALFMAAGEALRLPIAFPNAYFVYPGLLSLALLIALGLDRLLVPPEGVPRRRVWLPAFLVIASGAGLFYISVSEPRGRLVALAALLLIVLIVRTRWMSVTCALALAGLLFVDLTAASVSVYRHPYMEAPACYKENAAALSAAEEQALDGRVIVSASPLDFGLPANVGMLFPTLRAADGRQPLTKAQAVWWRRLGPDAASAVERDSGHAAVFPEAADPRLLNYMAARVVLATAEGGLDEGVWPERGPVLRALATEGGARVLLNEEALPRAYWVPAWRMVEGVAAAADVLSGAAFDPARECAIDRDSPGYSDLVSVVGAPRTEEDAPGDAAAASSEELVACELADDSPERVTVRLTSYKPGVVVLADTFSPGWEATLDGAPAPILQANGIFRGIATPAGEHKIVFRYRPRSFMAGAAVSLGSLALLTLTGLIQIFRGR
ncbi:MAG: YfhO family protein [Nitrospiraceae bacterium]|nr:YfhO family protein [Nitrospiraceae bacterium]